MIGSGLLDDMAAGFGDPVGDTQRIFRHVLTALSRPGSSIDLDSGVVSPVPGFAAAAAVALTLLDFETPVFLPAGDDGAQLGRWLRFHCGCPLTDQPKSAAFAILHAKAMLPLAAFDAGDPKYPDRSTTLVLTCAALTGGPMVDLTGPGIRGSMTIAPLGLPDGFWAEVLADRGQFPLGIDIILAAGDAIIGLPRSTRVGTPRAAQIDTES